MFGSKQLSNEEIALLLNCRRLPGRLSTSGAAVVLGFAEHEIAPLVAARVLTPLGKPARNAPKYFSSSAIEKAAADEKWLSRATQTITKYWAEKNSRKEAGIKGNRESEI